MENLPKKNSENTEHLTLTSNTESMSVDMSKVTPITKADCLHEFVKDPTEESEHFYAEVCLHCPLGRLVKR